MSEFKAGDRVMIISSQRANLMQCEGWTGTVIEARKLGCLVLLTRPGDSEIRMHFSNDELEKIDG